MITAKMEHISLRYVRITRNVYWAKFKSITTKSSNQNDNIKGRKIWQRSFHDHIIRNEPEYQKIWEYIDTNQLKWELDCYYAKLA